MESFQQVVSNDVSNESTSSSVGAEAPAPRAVEQITFLAAPKSGRGLRKTLGRHGSEKIPGTDIYKTVTVEDFPKITWYEKQTENFSSLSELFDIFQRVEKSPEEPRLAVVRGEFLDMAAIRAEEKRRQTQEPESLPYFQKRRGGRFVYRRVGAIIKDVPRRWVCIDIDGLEFPELGEFDVTNPRKWVDAALRQEMGEEFTQVPYVIQLSTSAGVKPGVRAHVWLMVSQPMDRPAWETWVKRRKQERGVAKLGIDVNLFRPGQLHYIAKPGLQKGTPDPVAAAYEAKGLEPEGSGRLILVNDHVAPGAPEEVFIRDWTTLSEAAAVERAKVDAGGYDGADDEEQDALTKRGTHGAFNRVFRISDLIDSEEAPLRKFFEPLGGGRVTWRGSESGSIGSAKIFANDTKMFCTSNSCPRASHPGTAFEWFQTCLFGPGEEHYGPACRAAEEIPEVRAEILRTRAEDAQREFDDHQEAEAAQAAQEGDAELVEVQHGATAPHAAQEAPTALLAAQDATAPAQAATAPTAASIAAEYPAPLRLGGAEALYKWHGGAWRYGYLDSDEDDDAPKKKKKFKALWSPITISREFVDVETNVELIEFKLLGSLGKPVVVRIPRSEFTGGARAVAPLAARGWRFTTRADAAYVNYVNNTSGKNITVTLPKRGWQNNKAIFATPGGEIIGAPDGANMELDPDKVIPPHMAKAGTLEGWREAVDTICAHHQHQNTALGVVAGLIGSLPPGVVEHAMPGFVFKGETRSGKSMGARGTVSLWAHPLGEKLDPEPSSRLFHVLSSTATSVDNLAAFANGTVLILDEIGATDQKFRDEIWTHLYRLAGGQGKIRTAQTGTDLRASVGWRAACIMTSEHDLQNLTSKRAPQGIAARFLTVPFTLPSESEKGQREAYSGRLETFLRGISANFGHAGPAFIRAVIGMSVDELRAAIKAERDTLKGDAAAGGVRDTALDIIATLQACGRIAHCEGIIGYPTMLAVEGACKSLWISFSQEQGKPESERASELVTQYINANLGSIHELSCPGERVIGGARGFRGPAKDDEGKTIPGKLRCYFTTDQLVTAAGGVWDATKTAQLLRDAGLLVRPNDPQDNRLKVQKRGLGRVYAVDIEEIFESRMEGAEG